MSRSFLALCQDVVADLGITGGVIQTVTANTSTELVRIVNWVARADILVQSLWSDWNFLWFKDVLTIGAGTDTFQTTKAFNDIDHRSLVFNPDITGVQPSYPVWMDWERFMVTWQNKIKTVNASPTCWSIDPSGKIWLSHLTLAALPAKLNYWTVPVRMVNGTDTSPIPTQYDTIIVERAKLLYAQRENAVEILTGSTAEYMDTLDKLESACLPNGRAARKSRNDSTTNPDGFVE
jgi:hypothetical protein